MQEYELEVHFRYVSNGEQEKDFENHTVEAISVEDAVKEVLKQYGSHSCIPFSVYHNNVKVWN